MKKIFLGMLAIAAMIATSCVQDQDLDLGVNAGGETVAVSFNLDTPTRAYSDGLTATVLQYAIYDANGNELVDLTVNDGEIHGSTTVTLQLVTGNTYTAIFWAAAPGAPYAVNFANKKVTVDYTAPVCNDEDRDAFFCHTAPFTVDGAMTVEAKLYRPFAQINIGVSDYALATAAGFTPTHSAVKVSNAYNTLNLWDGSVEGETPVTFESAEIEKNEVFPVTGYEYLAMNYILVNEQETIDVEFSYTDENATGAVESTKTCNVGSVPVQRNYRTNIYGAILTSNVDIKVEIVPAYEEPDYDEPLDINFVTTLEQLQAAINAASSTTSLNVVSFAADISGNVLINQKADVNLQINGCGYKFDGVFTIDGKGRSNGAETLTFSNINFETEGSDFTFIVSPKKLSDVWSYSHNVIVDGCTFKGNNTVGCVSLTQTYHPVVKNCTATGVHSLAQFQSCDNDILVENVTINAKNGISVGNTARPTIKNATIVATGYGVRGDGDQNRGALAIENSNITAAQPVIIRKVTTPYSVTLGEGVELHRTAGKHDVIFTKGQDDEAYVAPAEANVLYTSVNDFVIYPAPYPVASWEAFTTALADGEEWIILDADITSTASYTLKKNVKLDLNGKSFIIDNVKGMLNIGDQNNSTKPNVIIRNGNFNSIIYALSGNVEITDVVFGGTTSLIAASQGVISTKHANLLMDNCKMTNVKKSGTAKPRSICTEGRSSGYLILRNCNFKNSNLDRPYFNPINGSAVLELTNCALYGLASNIDIGATCVWSNLKLTGCTGGFTFTISRASTSLTEEELAVYKAIKQNNSGSMRFIFSDGEKNNL